jgi:hypothetical protein
VVSHLDDQYHLWRDTHKEISHNFSQVEKLERRVREIEGKMESLEIKDEGVSTRLTAMEDLGRGLSGYVVQMTRTIVGQGLRLDILQRLVTAFVLFGSNGGGGPGPSDETDGPSGGFGSGGRPPSCPSLVSLDSSWLDSPTIDSPASISGPDPFQSSVSNEADWFRSTLQAIAGSEVEDVRDSGLRGDRGDSWDMGGDAAIGRGVGDASDRGESRRAGLPELQPLVISPTVL